MKDVKFLVGLQALICLVVSTTMSFYYIEDVETGLFTVAFELATAINIVVYKDMKI